MANRIEQKFSFHKSTDLIGTPAEVLTELDFATHANWNATDDVDDTGTNATHTHSAGVGTLTQELADFAAVMVGGARYIFSYTVSSFSGDVTCEITTGVANLAAPLTMVNGAQTTTFTSKAVPGDFVLDFVSSSGAVTLDDVSLKRVDQVGALVTIQQPASGAKQVNFVSARIFCEVATVVTLSIGGTAATALDESAAIRDLTQRSQAALAEAYGDSDVGAGSVVSIHDVAALGVLVLDLSGHVFDGGTGATNLTISTDDVTGFVRITIVWEEQ